MGILAYVFENHILAQEVHMKQLGRVRTPTQVFIKLVNYLIIFCEKQRLKIQVQQFNGGPLLPQENKIFEII